MRRFVAQCAAVLASILAMVMWAIPASASAPTSGNPDNDIIRYLTVIYRIDESGSVFVTETYRWDFRNREGLGFYRDLVVEMGWEPDPSLIRIYDYSDFSASSSTGAPAYIWEEGVSNHQLHLAIGAPDGSYDTRTGVQSYTISYRVDGVINQIRGQDGVSDQDEFYYNVMTRMPIRVGDISVTVVGPDDVVDIACYQGYSGSQNPCDLSSQSGTSATFISSDLVRGSSFTIMTAYPAGTFSNPGPILVPASQANSSDRIPSGLTPPGESTILNWMFSHWYITLPL